MQNTLYFLDRINGETGGLFDAIIAAVRSPLRLGFSRSVSHSWVS
jgi:hypothetical protein